MAKQKDSQPPPSDGPAPLPDPASVVSEFTFTSPKGRVYRVRRTDQKDEYEEPPKTTPGPKPPDDC